MSNEIELREYLRGALLGIAAVGIWVSWILAVRLGIRTNLAPWDIVAIRFGVAGLILLPYLLKKGLAVDRLGWAGVAALMVGGGAPAILVSYSGLLFAPAADAASLFTALIPQYVAIVAAVALGEAFTIAKRIGLVLIVTGVLGIVTGVLGIVLGRGRHDWIAAEHRPCPVHRCGLPVGRLRRGHGKSKIRRASRWCYCSGRVIDHLCASVRDYFRDQSVQGTLA